MRQAVYIFGVLSTMGLFYAFVSCKNDGLVGRSKTKEEAQANGSTVLEYIPDKRVCNLLDGTKVQIENAWTETSFTHHGGRKVFNQAYGFHFAVPFHYDNKKEFNFTFDLADTTNRVFTNGIEENICYLSPRTLLDKMKIVLIQKNPDLLKGWTEPIISDTITFNKIDK